MDERHGDVSFAASGRREASHPQKEVAHGRGRITDWSMLRSLRRHFQRVMQAMGGAGGSMKNIAIGCFYHRAGGEQAAEGSPNGVAGEQCRLRACGRQRKTDDGIDYCRSAKAVARSHLAKRIPHISMMPLNAMETVDCGLRRRKSQKPAAGYPAF